MEGSGVPFFCGGGGDLLRGSEINNPWSKWLGGGHIFLGTWGAGAVTVQFS